MRFIWIVNSDERSEAGVLPTEQELSAMGAYNEELIKAGMMLAGEGLHASSKGSRVRIEGKKTRIVDGPFAEAKELVAGFWVIQAKSKEEALTWAKRAPFVDGRIEIRPLYEAEDFGGETQAAPPPPARQPGTTRYMVLLKADARTEQGGEASPELIAAMGALMQEMTESGALLAGDGLKPTSQGARVVFERGKPTVVDGPFTESKELVAGYTLVQTKTKAEAAEFGRRMLQIHMDGTGVESGEVEIRQVFEIEEFPVDAAEKPDGWRAIETAFRDGARQ